MSQPIKYFYEFGPFRLDAGERLLLRDGESVSLTPKAFDLLLALVEHHVHLLEKDELMKLVWPDTFVEEANLSYNISLIRKALGDGANGHKFIETVPKRGYRFVADVREITPVESNLMPQASTEAGVKEEPVLDILPVVFNDVLPSGRSRFRARGAKFLLSFVVIGAVAFGLYRLVIQKRFQDRASGPPRVIPFTSFPGLESLPAFSPDGKQIAFGWDGEHEDNEDLYIKLVDAGEPLRLTTNPAADRFYAWSPDGNYIAFARLHKDGNAIFVIPALGGAERKVLSTAPRNFLHFTAGAWSPDGKLLAFSMHDAPKRSSSIFLLSLETLETRRLTSPPVEMEGGDWYPAFSPDGKSLAFHRARNLGGGAIYVVPITGGEPKQLILDRRLSDGLTWTPDGLAIIFPSAREGRTTLWKVAASGGEPERITPSGEDATFPHISPQGNRLAYQLWEIDRNILRAGISNQTEVSMAPARLIPSTKFENWPTYSPDGARVAFMSNRSGSLEVWVCNSDGANCSQLTSMPSAGCPSWSPDGRNIVFHSDKEGNWDIYVTSAEGGLPRRLTSEASDEERPAYSRDERWVYFNSNRTGEQEVWKIPIEGGQAVQVTKRGGLSPVESPDGKDIYYTKTNSGIWRMPVEGGEETLVLDQVSASNWVVTASGIYYISRARMTLEFFSFAANRSSQILAPDPKKYPQGISVSPDGRWILYTQFDRRQSDIMLMENFR